MSYSLAALRALRYLGLNLPVNKLLNFLDVVNGILELLEGLRALGCFGLAVENRLNEVLKLLELASERLLIRICTFRIEPIRGGTKFLLESRANRRSGSTNK